MSRGLQVPLTSITSIIAVNQATGILGIFFGPLADRFGYRVMMLTGMGILTAGMAAAGVLPVYPVVFVGLVLAGLGKNLFDPSLQAYVGGNVPYERRGMVIGLLEISWAVSTLVGMPLVGLMMERWGWKSPFFLLAVTGAMGMVVMAVVGGERKGPAAKVSGTGFRVLLKGLFEQKSSAGLLGFAFLVSMANDNLFVVYGAWFESTFHLGLAALGFSTAVIGVAELGGEFLTAFVSDRIGLKRAIFIGALASTCSYLLLPLCGASIFWAFAGLFLVFLGFEFTIVSSISLCTELMPKSRATMMSGFLAAAGAGRVVGALMGGPLWIRFGISGVVVVSGVIGGLSLVCFIWGMRKWERY